MPDIMKVVPNGEIGLLVDLDHLNNLITREAINKEIDHIALGGGEIVQRKNNLVVDSEDYVDFLRDRLKILEEYDNARQEPTAMTSTSKSNITTHKSDLHNTTETTPKTDTSVNHHMQELQDMKLELAYKTELINRLLAYAKSIGNNSDIVSQFEDESIQDMIFNNEYVYVGDLPNNTTLFNTHTMGGLLIILANMESSNMSQDVLLNLAVARGLLGDIRSEKFSDAVYGKGIYDEFLNSLVSDSLDNLDLTVSDTFVRTTADDSHMSRNESEPHSEDIPEPHSEDIPEPHSEDIPEDIPEDIEVGDVV